MSTPVETSEQAQALRGRTAMSSFEDVYGRLSRTERPDRMFFDKADAPAINALLLRG